MPSSPPHVSVVVCTRDRASLAGECVASLLGQTADAHLFEILVVDSASGPRDRAALARLAQLGVRVLREEAPGLSRARNRGWREARAALVAYVDDDAIVARDWLEALLGFRLRHPLVEAFGGPYRARHDVPPPDWMPPGYGSLDLGPVERRLVIGREWLTGTNMVFSRRLLDELGGFDERLGMIGNRVAYGEETHLQARLARRGHAVWWVPAMRVEHRVAVVKHSLTWNLRATRRAGRAWASLGATPSVSGLLVHAVRSSKRLLEVRRAAEQPGGAVPWRRRAWQLLDPLWFVAGLWGEVGGRLRSRAMAVARRAERVARVRLEVEPAGLAAFRGWRQRVASLLPAGGLTGVRGNGEPGLVSVVVPVWNGARELRESLDSILGQTHARLELIVVDDGSTDATPEILAGVAARDRRVKVVRQENRQLPGALNAGFRLARGEYLTWSSHDNRWHPRLLESLVGFLRRRPDVDLVHADMELIGEDGERLVDAPLFWADQWPPGSGLVRLPRDLAELNARRNVLGLAFLWRDRVREVLGDFDPSRFGVEDWDWAMRANLLLRIAHVDGDEPLLAFRVRRGSLTDRADELGIGRAGEALLQEDRRRRAALESALLRRQGRRATLVATAATAATAATVATTEAVGDADRLGLYRELARASGLRVDDPFLPSARS